MGEKERRGEEGKKGRKVRTENRVEEESSAAPFFVRSKQPLPKTASALQRFLEAAEYEGQQP